MNTCSIILSRQLANAAKQSCIKRSFSFLSQGSSSTFEYPKKRESSLKVFHQSSRSNFSFAGPKKLDEILKTDLIKDKSKADVSDLWMAYHEGKENTFGSVLSKEKGELLLKRAGECPIFIQPVFREGGFFTLLSQFQSPSYFFLAYLEDFKMDPNRAQPLVTCSVFSDLSDKLDIHLVRSDVISKGMEDIEGFKAAESILQTYIKDEEFEKVKTFNHDPDNFDFDDYISCQNQKWKDESTSKSETK